MSEPIFIVDISELADVDGLCRVCLTESKAMYSLDNTLENIYEVEVSTILQALQRVSSNQLSDDPKYPTYICSMCLSFLNIAYKFLLQMELSQKQLCEHFSEYEDDYEPTNVVNKENDVVAPVAPVEIISDKGKYNLQDLVIVEMEEEDKSTFEGFLKNLGSEVTADYVRNISKRKKRNKKEEQYVVNVIPLSKKNEIVETYVEEERETVEEDTDTSHPNVSNDITKETLSCDICDKRFARLKNLSRHIKEVHLTKENKDFICPLCGHIANVRSSLRNHMLLMHFGKKFACEICGKKYLTRSHLRQHENVHRNERLHLCTVCGKSFNYANALQYHMRTHTGEKKYKCTFCDKAFSMQCGLNRHLRTHTGIRPYSCQFCDKAFRSRGEVVCHEMIHTGYRPFSCKYCGKGFTKSHNLKVHLMGHTGSHVCDFCQRGFIEVIYLKMHMKIAHGLSECDDLEQSTILYISAGENNFEDLSEAIVYASS